MSNSIFIGILSGLITYVIVLFIGKYWKRVLIPWFDNRLYTGTRIDGTWQTTMCIGNETTHESATLKQYGNKVTGDINYPKDTEGKSHKYVVEGKFQDGTLILLQEEIGPQHQDLGGIVLEFIQGGAKPMLEGLGVWSNDGKIVAVPYKWIAE